MERMKLNFYNFALPPLTLHTFHTGDARVLSNWAKTLTLSSKQTTFFNFLASHDGIGLNPARGILSGAEIDSLVDKTLEHGGLISYKHNTDGSQAPYEMNINFDALSNQMKQSINLQINRFIAVAIMLSLIVPGIYFTTFGSRGWVDGVKQTGRNRTINRESVNLKYCKTNLQMKTLCVQIFLQDIN
jgi:sucrose phosphorylase